MLTIGKLVLALLILALAGQQLINYYDIVVVGTFTSTAAFHQLVIVGLVWPVVVVAVAGFLLWKIVTFKVNKQH